MVVSHLVWRLRTRGIRQRAKEQGKTFDESEEGIAWQAQGIDCGAKLRRLFGMKEKLDMKVGQSESTIMEEDVAAVGQKNMVPNAVV
jgi:hypothetical protein